MSFILLLHNENSISQKVNTIFLFFKIKLRFYLYVNREHYFYVDVFLSLFWHYISSDFTLWCHHSNNSPPKCSSSTSQPGTHASATRSQPSSLPWLPRYGVSSRLSLTQLYSLIDLIFLCSVDCAFWLSLSLIICIVQFMNHASNLNWVPFWRMKIHIDFLYAFNIGLLHLFVWVSLW